MNSPKTITLLQINDTHGYLLPHPELFWKAGEAEYRISGGYARLRTVFQRVREEMNGAVIALDNGDTFHGTYHAVQTAGEALGNVELPGHIRTLREQERVDLVVVLSHLGFPQDVKLAEEVPGIDVLLSGHTHNRMDRPLVVNGAIIIQSGCHGSFVGRLDLALDGGNVTVLRHQLIHVDDRIQPDAEMEQSVENAVAPHRAMLAEIVGLTETPLNRNTFLESTMDNLLLQAVAEGAGTRIAFSNGWRYGAPIQPGPVTVNDLWNIIPPNPPLSTVELTGQEIWDMIEENLERTMAADPYQQMGGYVKRCLGINLYVKFENPPGSRIQQIFMGEEELDRSCSYTVAFVTSQGVPKKFGRNRVDLEVHAIDAMKSYLALHPTANADLRDTVVAV